MFFYDALGTSGIPAALMQFMATNFPDQLGLAFSKLGMVPDPTSTTNMPLGIAPTVPLNGNIDAVAFTCASCHFAQLPDGRYAVGAPDHGYDYARNILAITLAPTIGSGLEPGVAHDPAAVALVQPVLDALSSNATLKGQMLSTLLPLASLKLPSMSTDEEHDYTEWPTGTMDFLIAPLPVDDHVHTVSKNPAAVGHPVERRGGGDGHDERPARLGRRRAGSRPLRVVVRRHRPGQHPAHRRAARAARAVHPVAAGAEQPHAARPDAREHRRCPVREQGLHELPRRSARQRQARLRGERGRHRPGDGRVANPDGGAYACCGVPTAPGGLTHGLKSPRLVGMWAQSRLLHNGALSSLEQLFCLEADGGAGDGGRPAGAAAPMENVGHDFTCDNLSPGEKEALMAYLRAH